MKDRVRGFPFELYYKGSLNVSTKTGRKHFLMLLDPIYEIPVGVSRALRRLMLGLSTPITTFRRGNLAHVSVSIYSTENSRDYTRELPPFEVNTKTIDVEWAGMLFKNCKIEQAIALMYLEGGAVRGTFKKIEITAIIDNKGSQESYIEYDLYSQPDPQNKSRPKTRVYKGVVED